MQQLHACSTVAFVPGMDGDLHIVLESNGYVLVDTQSEHCDAEGRIRREHAAIRLTHDALAELRDAIDEILVLSERADPRQMVLA